MANKPKGRFIAGAVCPRCAEMDKLIVYQEDGAEVRECVECGYVDKMNSQGIPEPQAEMETRVNKKPEVKKSTSATINFFPNPKKKK